ncbi:MAG TPA: ferritin-like domain-containing protein [Vicinamibacterales bacterium]|nr:ferritin-like domain-containing protein [Vicinamibacterales bacterium]
MAHEKSVKLLNDSVADELQAVHQYMYFHFHLSDQGFQPLADLFKRTAITEMGHVEALAERLLFLKQDVRMAAAGAIEAITDPTAILEKARAMEEASARDYNRAVGACDQDTGSRQVFERLIEDEEQHFDAFDKHLEHIKRFGPSYLALQSFAADAPNKSAQTPR